MKVDTIPTKKITAKKIDYSIFTGTKFCFVSFDNQKDFSWDGEKEIVEWNDKGESVLFSAKELEAFRPNDTVHSFLYNLRQQRKEELARLKKEVKTAKSFWVHSKYAWIKKPNMGSSQSRSLIMENFTYNPKQRIQDRIDFLENNEIFFVEINFQ